MQFRHLLFVALVSFVAFAFPDDTFAKDNGQPENKNAQNAQQKVDTVKKEISKPTPSPQAKPEKPLQNKVEKTLPAQASEKASKAKSLPEKASDKTSNTKQLPEKAGDKAKQAVNKVKEEKEKAVNSNQPSEQAEKKSSATEKKEETEVKASPQTVVTTTPSVKETTSNASEKGDDVKPVKTSKEEVSVDPKKEDEPPVKKENNVPIKAVNPHSSVSQKSSEGSSKDRTSKGSNAKSTFDKFIVNAEAYLIVRRVQPLISKQLQYRNQWDHAPPSPPPQDTPFF
ncbi:hypothetical protein [Bacillus sp. AFS040349]|uniref:hypothetical protein n=1 Tax=Bacillaceae TaxID=186817 RepID=UPI000BFB53C6|nr:hypothetical protein [Bacillus sp. AFS040349]PGT89653.1 hypothetical protein COD11_03875 [Bacillus sp. AFS040349]